MPDRRSCLRDLPGDFMDRSIIDYLVEDILNDIAHERFGVLQRFRIIDHRLFSAPAKMVDAWQKATTAAFSSAIRAFTDFTRAAFLTVGHCIQSNPAGLCRNFEGKPSPDVPRLPLIVCFAEASHAHAWLSIGGRSSGTGHEVTATNLDQDCAGGRTGVSPFRTVMGNALSASALSASIASRSSFRLRVRSAEWMAVIA